MRTVTIAALLTVIALPAAAQPADRYQMERSGEGFVRLDTQTGEMAFCDEVSGRITCRATQEGSESAMAAPALEARIAELEKRIAALEARPGTVQNVPTEQEFEQTLTFMERFFRRFIGIVKEFEDEKPTTPPPATAPDRT